jgi:hypothetical protein
LTFTRDGTAGRLIVSISSPQIPALWIAPLTSIDVRDVVGAISDLSGFVFARLEPSAGAEMSGHAVVRAKPAADPG